MKKMIVLAFVAAMMTASHLFADGILKGRHQAPCCDTTGCEPGYMWVEEVCYREVERFECKTVPDVKKHKKTVYSCKEDPFCIKGGSGGFSFLNLFKRHNDCCETCPSCDGPFCRIKLIKKEVVCEEPTTKCVVERVVDKVAYTVRKKVPCGSVPCPTGTHGVPAPESVGSPLPVVIPSPAPTPTSAPIVQPAPANQPAPAVQPAPIQTIPAKPLPKAPATEPLPKSTLNLNPVRDPAATVAVPARIPATNVSAPQLDPIGPALFVPGR